MTEKPERGRRGIPRYPTPVRAGILAWCCLQAGCTHATVIHPGRESAALVSAQVAVADRDIRVQTVSGEAVRLGRVNLTSDSILGAIQPAGGPFSAPLSRIDRFSFKSRWKGVRDWVALGAIGGAIGVPVMFREAWGFALAPLGAIVGATYGVFIGSIFGSKVEFRIQPGD